MEKETREAIVRQVMNYLCSCRKNAREVDDVLFESCQVEHYMSLGNLATDTFLRSQMSACASGFMGVPLSLLASFPRIRSLCPVGEGTAKSRDDVIADILLDSKDVLVEHQKVHCVCTYEYMQSCHTHTRTQHTDTHTQHIQHIIFLTPCTLLAVSTAKFMHA
jgi:hypothetical protein